jgi:triphosphoribosyl-dephospho-CoA synthase
MSGLAPGTIADAYVEACLAELLALKPGNVHVHDPNDAADVLDFEASAAVSAAPLTAARASIGERILGAVRATRARVGWNTNLGIVLLCAPIAAAAEEGTPVIETISRLLRGLTVGDAADAFAAISLANPGGIGKAETHDVHETPAVTLRQAMAAAADRDRIARAYAGDLGDILNVGLPTLAQARGRGLSEVWAVAAVHMAFMATDADSHIARKFGPDAAEASRRQAEAILSEGPIGPARRQRLAKFDAMLKHLGHNPGTSADFTVATVFLDKILLLASAKS